MIGGDGFMLQTLKKNKKSKKLFYGVNSGNYGFLMNKFSSKNFVKNFVKSKRKALKVFPVYKKVDTCAAEFKSFTPYMYSTYQRNFSFKIECESEPTNKKKVIILGGGPNRIGQGIEFDYCCCHACFSLSASGYETIMINCNPETVSTDYDTSDRLYFEPLSLESVLEIVRVEERRGTVDGVIVQLGGQTPLNLAKDLESAGVRILGTSTDSIDHAEDRERFQKLIRKLQLAQPPNGIASSKFEAQRVAKEIGFPIVIRPSYVLGGRAMEILRNGKQLTEYIAVSYTHLTLPTKA